MKGLELCRRYYEEYGVPMLERFPAIRFRIAAGLCGSGSECFGYDDAVSRDHDFEPGFVLFLTAEDSEDRKTVFQLERAYDALPKEFLGVKRERMAPVGGRRHGVIGTADFFFGKCGSPDGALSPRAWLTLPEQSLAEAVNGEIFSDPLGEVTRIREKLAYFPEDIRRKKLAGQLLLMKQAGCYNYPRILAHGEEGAAQLAAIEFTEAAISAVFLLNRRYRPFYKWAFRALRELPLLGELADSFEYLLTSDNGKESVPVKTAVIGDVCALVLAEARRQGLTDGSRGKDPGTPDDPEAAAYAVNDGIADGEIRNLHILAGV